MRSDVVAQTLIFPWYNLTSPGLISSLGHIFRAVSISVYVASQLGSNGEIDVEIQSRMSSLYRLSFGFWINTFCVVQLRATATNRASVIAFSLPCSTQFACGRSTLTWECWRLDTTRIEPFLGVYFRQWKFFLALAWIITSWCRWETGFFAFHGSPRLPKGLYIDHLPLTTHSMQTGKKPMDDGRGNSVVISGKGVARYVSCVNWGMEKVWGIDRTSSEFYGEECFGCNDRSSPTNHCSIFHNWLSSTKAGL